MMVEFTMQDRPDLYDKLVAMLESREAYPFTMLSPAGTTYNPRMAVAMIAGTRERFTVKLESVPLKENTR